MAKTKLKSEELLEAFEDMSVLELSEFLKAFEEKFDVTAAAPVAESVAPAGFVTWSTRIRPRRVLVKVQITVSPGSSATLAGWRGGSEGGRYGRRTFCASSPRPGC